MLSENDDTLMNQEKRSANIIIIEFTQEPHEKETNKKKCQEKQR